MAQAMFEASFVDGPAKVRKPLALTLSLILEIGALAVAIILPLIFTDSLPRSAFASVLVAPVPPPPPPPPPRATPASPKKPPKHFQPPCSFCAPKDIPKGLPKEIVDDPPGQVANNSTGGVPGSVPGSVGPPPILIEPPKAPPPPPPPPEPKKPQAPKQIVVGGKVQEASLERKVIPQYPSLAKSARISGEVVFKAVIDKDGNIKGLQLLSGHPLLVEAARSAVSQWHYRPTELNGEKVEVITTITVNFVLSQ